MPKLGVGKVDAKVSYRILEEQEKYVRNLYREKLRKKVKTTPSEEIRYLLDLGIKMHREGRREKFEMSGYFRAEVRTFTENFFKEHDDNYLTKLLDINRNMRFIVLLLIECLRMLYLIYVTVDNQTSFEEETTNEAKNDFYAQLRASAKKATDKNIEHIQKQMGRDGEILHERMKADRGIAF